MDSVRDRLDHLAATYHLTVPGLLILLGGGIGGSPLLAWTGGSLLVLLTANKLRAMRAGA